MMEENIYVGITLIRGFYVNDTKKQLIIVLYYINGVVIAAQCTATFLRSIVLLKSRYY